MSVIIKRRRWNWWSISKHFIFHATKHIWCTMIFRETKLFSRLDIGNFVDHQRTWCNEGAIFGYLHLNGATRETRKKVLLKNISEWHKMLKFLKYSNKQEWPKSFHLCGVLTSLVDQHEPCELTWCIQLDIFVNLRSCARARARVCVRPSEMFI